MEKGAIFFTGEDEVEYNPGEGFIGSTWQRLVGPVEVAIRSLNALTGDLQWEFQLTTDPRNALTGESLTEYRRRTFAEFNRGGVLSTAGGVVFGGLGKWFLALHANTGRELWRMNSGGEIKAAPITFFLEGKQMVTVAAGRSILTFGLAGTLTLHQPGELASGDGGLHRVLQ